MAAEDTYLHFLESSDSDNDTMDNEMDNTLLECGIDGYKTVEKSSIPVRAVIAEEMGELGDEDATGAVFLVDVPQKDVNTTTINVSDEEAKILATEIAKYVDEVLCLG